ncbi:hypothetical protein HDV00_005916 [Rhizophlyctis rosea]|nr:hypothetical protein HDV00_005916 [Rhizophlyctis rosea]
MGLIAFSRTPNQLMELSPDISTPTFGSKSAVTWDYDFHFPSIRDALNNSINGNNQGAVFLSQAFGPAGSQWRVKFGFVPTTGSPHIGAWCLADKSEEEINMGEDWFRLIHSMTISLKDPQRLKDRVTTMDKKMIVEGDGISRGKGWESYTSAQKFQRYFTPDGSLLGNVSLKWERATCDTQPSPPTGVDCSKFFLETFLSDVTLRITCAGRPRGVIDLPAHKVVLATRSPYFAALFSSGLSEASSTGRTTIGVIGFSPPTVEALLEFMYTHRLTRNPPQTLEGRLDLIRAADYYQMEDLHFVVSEQIVARDLNYLTALKILVEANKCKGICSVLSDRVKEFLKMGWEDFTKNQEFRDSMREYGTGDLLADLYE